MIYKDLVEHYEIKNLIAVKYYVRRVMANITKPTSINKIYHELKSLGVVVGKIIYVVPALKIMIVNSNYTDFHRFKIDKHR